MCCHQDRLREQFEFEGVKLGNIKQYCKVKCNYNDLEL